MYLFQLFIAFISLFALSVLFHELGHFIFSKLAGVKVYEFSIGLPFFPRLCTVFQYKETKFTLKVIPIGGYVSYTPPDKKEIESISEFLKYPGWRRLIATLGGPLFNFIFAFLVIVIVHMNGVLAPSMQIDEVMASSPSDVSGLKKGDVVLSVNEINIDDWEKLGEIINKSKESNLRIIYTRDGQNYNTEIIPKKGELQIGIIPVYIFQQYSLSKSIDKSLKFTERIFFEFYLLLKRVVRGKGAAKDFSGPVGIAKTTKKAVDKGNNTYWLLLAFFSINLGIINLFPLPALDGGHIIAYSIETIMRKNFELRIHQIFGVIGMLVILSVMLLVMYSDVITLWSK